MFYFTVSFRKKGFYDMKDILPLIDIFPFTLFKLPTSICRKDRRPECFFPSRISLYPGSMATSSVMWMLKSELECGCMA